MRDRVSPFQLSRLVDLFYALRIYFVLLLLWQARPAEAEVAVLANRTVSTITVEVVRSGELPQNFAIRSGESSPVFFQRSLQVRFGEGIGRQQYALQPGNAYFFLRDAATNSLEMEQIGLGEQPMKSSPPLVPKRQRSPAPVTIAVKVLADDDEPTHRRIWEQRLRQRIAAASEILEQHTGVRLKVVEVATWESDDKQHNFLQTLREFEREVKPQPGQLTIGFSSQFQAVRGRTHLGVTRWPLHTHILLKERSKNLLETERLELLVHELGHYFGASHSPEPQSVMRPVLTRGPQRGVGSRIQFDPVNALLIAMTGDEMRRNGVRDVRSLSPATAKRMAQIYRVLQEAMPYDPAARQYLRILERAKAPPPVDKPPIDEAQQPSFPPLVKDTQQILGHLLQVARRQNEAEAAQEPLPGDELTNLYVRQACQVAQRLRSANSKRALLLALGIFMDDSETLRSFPGTSAFIRRVESEEQREERINVMGKPTMRERRDLVKHFFVSAHLVVVGGVELAAGAGLAKEMLDSQGGTGFSFVDMAANRAGIVLAERLLAKELSLADLASRFHVDDYLPTLVGLEEGLTAGDLQKSYGGAEQTTVAEQLEQIEQRVLSLPVYDQPEE